MIIWWYLQLDDIADDLLYISHSLNRKTWSEGFEMELALLNDVVTKLERIKNSENLKYYDF
ncbi:hypothetical protein [Staphylococcus xylosus]